MRAALLIAAKDLRQRIRDRSAFMLGIIAPLGLAFIFSFIIPDFEASAFQVQAGVFDADQSELSQTFTGPVLTSVAADGLIVLSVHDNSAELQAEVEAGELGAGWIIPTGFESAVLAGQSASIEVLGHVDAQISTQIVAAIAASYAADVSEAQLAGAGAALSGLDPGAAAAATQSMDELLVVADVSASSKGLAGTTFFSAGMAVFFLFFTVQFGVTSLIEERTIGTMPRLLAAPISALSIVGGKAMASFVVGLVSMIVLAVATSLLVGAEWGDPVAVGALMVCGVLAALGIMGLIASVAKSAEQAANSQSIVAVVLGLLGGTFFPLSQGPGLLANLSLLTPHAWFMRGLGDLAGGGGIGDVLGPVAALLVFAIVTSALASLRIRRMVSV